MTATSMRPPVARSGISPGAPTTTTAVRHDPLHPRDPGPCHARRPARRIGDRTAHRLRHRGPHPPEAQEAVMTNYTEIDGDRSVLVIESTHTISGRNNLRIAANETGIGVRANQGDYRSFDRFVRIEGQDLTALRDLILSLPDEAFPP